VKEDLENLAIQADLLGRDYDEIVDRSQVDYLIGLLGSRYPICILEEAAKHYREELRDIQNKQLPDMLMELGLGKVVTDQGLEISLKTEYNVSLLDPEQMSEWMDQNGGGHLWKESLKFDKGQDISAVRTAADHEGLSYEVKDEIHPQTLKKFVKEYLEGGGELIPESIARVGTFTHASIKRK
jgi:hypothetical protein